MALSFELFVIELYPLIKNAIAFLNLKGKKNLYSPSGTCQDGSSQCVKRDFFQFQIDPAIVPEWTLNLLDDVNSHCINGTCSYHSDKDWEAAARVTAPAILIKPKVISEENGTTIKT